MIQNISHTARKPSVREAENMIRVCVICHGRVNGLLAIRG